MVYSREIDGQTLTFGISGRLYKSNVLLYDHQSESLWSQLKNASISGPMVGQQLKPLPSVRVSWKQWQKMHPKTLVLSEQTGYDRNYRIDPYEGYYRIGSLMFPVGKVRTDLPTKTRVLGVQVGGRAKAYALEKLREQTGILEDRIGDRTIRIDISRSGEITAVRTEDDRPVPHMFVFWFAWQAFNPQTEVYQSNS